MKVGEIRRRKGQGTLVELKESFLNDTYWEVEEIVSGHSYELIWWHLGIAVNEMEVLAWVVDQ